jgi:hypothetical protein
MGQRETSTTTIILYMDDDISVRSKNIKKRIYKKNIYIYISLMTF